ncbi:MAG: glycosyltransferase family 4 protein [Cytophagales bacterium]|nr:glycosyltransferase family 4 protein [Cytophagales bacterium]
MKKVLVITYYWPPSGGSGVQRWLKFVKYLVDFDWEAIVYTPENGESPVIDQSLFKDVPENITVLKKPIWEPYSLYKKFVGQKKEEKINTGFLTERERPKLAEKLSVWIRGNLFIPDARKFWIKPSVRYLTKYLKKNPVNAIVSTGPPHSMHLIALGLKQSLNIPWIADFRDPWTHIDFYDQLMLSKFADNKHKHQEKLVLENADKVVTVSYNWAKDFEILGAKNVNVITNGYDESDFEFGAKLITNEFILNHIGSLNKDRNPHQLWNALEELCKDDENFKKDLVIKLIGKTDVTVINSINKSGLTSELKQIQYLAHSEVLQTLFESQILLLLLNNTPNVMGVIPGKLFEYLAAKRPILCIGPPEGDSGKIIKDCNAGYVYDFEDKVGIKKRLKELYEIYKSEKHYIKSNKIERYSRKNLTRQMADLLNEIV